MRRLFILFLLVSLSACTIGNGHICGPQTPIFYCDKEAYDKLLHPKPFVELWHKPAVSSNIRLNDWVSCGGYGDGNFTLQSKKMFPGEDDNKAYKRLRTEMYRCLIDKGYRYERCDEPAFRGDAICGGK
ncbi:hypothetical protein C8E02_2239 [Vogesella indigofera]|uniref:Lipoprotein n=1 Tax=Vogesella indigofera TaxID=45465 RepID=A0A495BCK5_VOGIN|nr:hypothetical protein C8E02_2239 [Vogesella indigofera]